MKKSISLALALVLCISSAFILTASALIMGDINNDGQVQASDARLALRASVGLENLTADQKKAADVDSTVGVTAADARLILRASVGLEELKPKEYTFNGHKSDSDTIGITKGITCVEEGHENEVLMPSFNELVNALKQPGTLNYFYGFTKTTTVTAKPTVKESSVLHLALAKTMESLLSDSVEPGTVTDYSDLTNRRHVNNATFFVSGKPYISDLTDNDIKSITMQKMSGVDFVKSLPNSYKSTMSGATYNLSSVKSSAVGDVYKVTVTLNTERMTDKNIPTSTTPIEKIISATYNTGLKNNMKALSNTFDEIPEMADMIGMEIEIETDCIITYYFTADKFEPVAAKYDVNMKTVSKMHTYFDNFFIKHKNPTTTMTVSSTAEQSDYFFFNDHFSFKK